jgi:hypothetical protein
MINVALKPRLRRIGASGRPCVPLVLVCSFHDGMAPAAFMATVKERFQRCIRAAKSHPLAYPSDSKIDGLRDLRQRLDGAPLDTDILNLEAVEAIERLVVDSE